MFKTILLVPFPCTTKLSTQYLRGVAIKYAVDIVKAVFAKLVFIFWCHIQEFHSEAIQCVWR